MYSSTVFGTVLGCERSCPFAEEERLNTPEYKEESVHQITEHGYSIAEVSDRLGVSARSLYKRLQAIKPDNSEQHARDLPEAKREIMQ